MSHDWIRTSPLLPGRPHGIEPDGADAARSLRAMIVRDILRFAGVVPGRPGPRRVAEEDLHLEPVERER